MSDEPAIKSLTLGPPIKIMTELPDAPRLLSSSTLATLAKEASAQLPFGATHRYTIDRRYQTGADYRPFSVVLDGDELLAVLLGAAGEIVVRCYGADAQLQKTVGRYACGQGSDEIGDPAGIALDGAGNIYLLDSARCSVLKLDPAGRVLTRFGGEEGIAPGALFQPRDLEVSSDGAMLLADTRNNRIQSWDAAGRHVLTIGPAVDEDADEEVPAGAGYGEFSEPMGVTTDSRGHIYVADTGNHRVQVFTADGSFLRVFGSEGEGSGQLYFPTDVRVGRDGEVFVFDLHSRRVQQFTPDGQLAYGMVLLPQGPECVVGAVGDIDVGADEALYVPVPSERVILRVRKAEGWA